MAQSQVVGGKGKKSKRKIVDNDSTGIDASDISAPISLSFKTVVRPDNKWVYAYVFIINYYYYSLVNAYVINIIINLLNAYVMNTCDYYNLFNWTLMLYPLTLMLI